MHRQAIVASGGRWKRRLRVGALALLVGSGSELCAQGLELRTSRFGAPSGAPAADAERMAIFLLERAGGTLLQLEGGRPNALAALVIGSQRIQVPIADGTLLVDPLVTQTLVLDGSGRLELLLPALDQAGQTFTLQWLAVDALSRIAFSRGLEVRVAARTPISASFDRSLAQTLNELAWNAYEYTALTPPPQQAPPGGGGPVAGRTIAGFTTQRVITSTVSGPFARVLPSMFLFVGKNAQGDLAVVFRGTDFLQVQDWLVDLNANQSEGFHEGFLTAYRSVESELLQALIQLAENDRRVYITGHSLGGALALVATHQLADRLRGGLGIARADIAAYSMGAPRAMSPPRANELRDKAPLHFAVANKDDLVTHVPRPRTLGFDYEHPRAMRVLYPRYEMHAEIGSDYDWDLAPPLTPRAVPGHLQQVYAERLANVLAAPSISLRVSGTGFMSLNWSFPNRGPFLLDYLAIYEGAPTDPTQAVPVGEWVYASTSSPFTTTRAKARNLYIAYVQQYGVGGERRFLATAGPYTWRAPTVRMSQDTGLVRMHWSIADPGAPDFVALYNVDPRTVTIPVVVTGTRRSPLLGSSFLTPLLWGVGPLGARYWIAYVERPTALSTGTFAAVAGPHR
jgi:hypothetical protein